MKSRVILEKEPIDPLSAAWMKELRTHNSTKREYAVDPYAEVYRFREDVYGILKDSADGMGAPWMYLIDGPEHALLIDTGFGIGNLKGLAEKLTGGKPLIVACTHAHFDHCYGNCQFERVYCKAALYSRHKRQIKFDGLGECSVRYRYAQRNANGESAHSQRQITSLMSGVKGLRAAVSGSTMNSGFAAALDTRPHRRFRVMRAALGRPILRHFR